MRQYQIKQSPILKKFNLSIYVLAIISIVSFADEMLMAGLLALLATLLMLSDYQRWQAQKQQPATEFIIHPDTGVIEIKHPYYQRRFKRFSLYFNRWFLVLRLKEHTQSASFLFIADRFVSPGEYLNFRKQMLKINRDQYAA